VKKHFWRQGVGQNSRKTFTNYQQGGTKAKPHTRATNCRDKLSFYCNVNHMRGDKLSRTKKHPVPYQAIPSTTT